MKAKQKERLEPGPGDEGGAERLGGGQAGILVVSRHGMPHGPASALASSVGPRPPLLPAISPGGGSKKCPCGMPTTRPGPTRKGAGFRLAGCMARVPAAQGRKQRARSEPETPDGRAASQRRANSEKRGGGPPGDARAGVLAGVFRNLGVFFYARGLPSHTALGRLRNAHEPKLAGFFAWRRRGGESCDKAASLPVSEWARSALLCGVDAVRLSKEA